MIQLILNESLLLWAIVIITTIKSSIQIVEGFLKTEKSISTHAGTAEIIAGVISLGVVLAVVIF